MSQSPFKTPEFQKLFQEWNQKLKEDGFIDAEDFSGSEDRLKDWHSFKRVTPDFIARGVETLEYIEAATELLFNGYPFKTDVQRRVWELHCQGFSVREIETKLSHQMIGYKGTTKTRVDVAISRIRKQAKLIHD